jgi:hypothetical protein
LVHHLSMVFILHEPLSNRIIINYWFIIYLYL